jgi:hypothetical protein
MARRWSMGLRQRAMAQLEAGERRTGPSPVLQGRILSRRIVVCGPRDGNASDALLQRRLNHAISTKGTGANDRKAAAKPAAPCTAPAGPVATDHAIHAACKNAVDKIACNRWEDYKATHKD